MDAENNSLAGAGSASMSTADVTEDILNALGSLQTDNKDDLVLQMKKLIGDFNVMDETAKFYLDMNGWNVAAAVGAYFDLEASPAARANPPSMTFVKDVTIGEGEAIPPETSFIKTWTVQNCGADTWPSGCRLRFTQGHRLGAEEGIDVSPLMPWQRADLSVHMRSPTEPGMYESQWRMMTPEGCFFGDTIWVIISVSPAGTMGLTQQMSSFSALGAEQQQHARVGQQGHNPFAVPTSPAQVVVTDPPQVIMPQQSQMSPQEDNNDDVSMN